MALESLGDIFKNSSKDGSFNRIYRARILQDKIAELLGQPVVVSLAEKTVKVWCSSDKLAVLANIKKTKIIALCHRVLARSDIRIQIKVKT